MSEEIPGQDSPSHMDELQEFDGGQQHLAINDLETVTVPISVQLGTCNMTVRDVLELEPGNILALDKLAGEMTDVLVNALPLARGEVVVLGDTLHVRIAEIRNATERDMGAYGY